MPADAVQITTTVESAEAAERIAHALVEERLAACVQVHGPVASTYRWEGSVSRATEWYCHVKTTRARLEQVTDRIRALHSYVTPEIIAVPLIGGLPEYLGWIAESVGDDS